MDLKTPPSQRVFIVEADPATRDAIKALASDMGVETRLCSSLEELQAAYRHSPAGCLVLAMQLPGMSGFELLESAARNGIWLPAVVLTERADVRSAVRAMQAGAITVIEKPYRDEEVRDAIRQALAIDAQFRQREAAIQRARARFAPLTTGERQVLDLILSGNTNKQIAADLRLGLRTVEARRHAVMTKLEARSLAELVKTVYDARCRPPQYKTSLIGKSPG